MPDNENPNSYFGALRRIAEALEDQAEGAGKPLTGHSYSLATDDSCTHALHEVILALGGEVTDA